MFLYTASDYNIIVYGLKGLTATIKLCLKRVDSATEKAVYLI